MRALAAAAAIVVSPALARAELPGACFDQRNHVTWTYPADRPIDVDEAVRVPTDATLRMGYVGISCPDMVSLTLTDGEGRAHAAQVRIQIPEVLAEHEVIPPAVIEIDPDGLLLPSTDYRLQWRVPGARIDDQANLTLDFKTYARLSEDQPLDVFEGVLAVELFPQFIGGGEMPSAFLPPDEKQPGCPAEARTALGVRYYAENRPDLLYAVERASSTPLDADGELIEERADTTPVLVGLEGGAFDPLRKGQSERKALVYVPSEPKRRECFRVRLATPEFRLVGDEDAVACIDLGEMVGGELKAPPGLRSCAPIELEGTVGEPEPDAGVPGAGGGADAGSGGGGGGGGCAVSPPNGANAGSLGVLGAAALALAFGRRARRRPAA